MFVKKWHPAISKRVFKDKLFWKVTYQSVCFKRKSVSQCLRRIPFWVDAHIWILFLRNCNEDQSFLPFTFYVCPCLFRDICCTSLCLAGSFCVSFGILVLVSFGNFSLSLAGFFVSLSGSFLCVLVSCKIFFVCLRLLWDLFCMSWPLAGSFLDVLMSCKIFLVCLVGSFLDVFVSSAIFFVCLCLWRDVSQMWQRSRRQKQCGQLRNDEPPHNPHYPHHWLHHHPHHHQVHCTSALAIFQTTNQGNKSLQPKSAKIVTIKINWEKIRSVLYPGNFCVTCEPYVFCKRSSLESWGQPLLNTNFPCGYLFIIKCRASSDPNDLLVNSKTPLLWP